MFKKQNLKKFDTSFLLTCYLVASTFILFLVLTILPGKLFKRSIPLINKILTNTYCVNENINLIFN